MGQFSELGDACARCDAEEAPYTMPLFTEWTDHVCEHHGVEVDGNLEAPLCARCYEYMRDMKESVLSGRDPPEEVVVNANLDRLRLDALAIEQP